MGHKFGPMVQKKIEPRWWLKCVTCVSWRKKISAKHVAQMRHVNGSHLLLTFYHGNQFCTLLSRTQNCICVRISSSNMELYRLHTEQRSQDQIVIHEMV